MGRSPGGAPWLWVSLTRVVCSSLRPLDSAKARQPLPPSPHLTLLGHDPSFTGFYNATHFKQRGVNKFIKSCILSCSFIPANLIDMIIMEKRENKSERGKVKISALGLNLSSQISASYFTLTYPGQQLLGTGTLAWKIPWMEEPGGL